VHFTVAIQRKPIEQMPFVLAKICSSDSDLLEAKRLTPVLDIVGKAVKIERFHPRFDEFEAAL
jgi:hypothetical protein